MGHPVGVDFATPEKYFLDKETRKFKIGEFDPRLLKNWPVFDYSPSADVVILAGYPAQRIKIPQTPQLGLF